MLPPWLHRLGQRLRRPATGGRGAAAPVHSQGHGRAVFEEMEPRLLHSADDPFALLAAPTVVVVDSTGGAPAAPVVSAPAPAAAAAQANPNPSQPASEPAELVFIDSRVPNAAGLVFELMQQRGSQGRFEIVMLDAGEDGVAQINKVLADRAGLAAIHIISHGSAGQLQLGSSMIDAQTLSAAAGSLGAWRAALSADADILLYGCDVASGPNGEAFLEMLAQLTGADVAGSVDLTGQPDFGGDWTLEARVGEVDSATIAGPQLSRMWRATLSEVPAETLSDGAPVVLGEAVAPEWFAGEGGSASHAPVPAGTVLPAAGGNSLIGTTPPAPTANETRREAVFVDAGLPDLDTLLADMAARPGTRIFVVTQTADALDFITRTLADEGVTWDSIHLLGHGAPGSLTLGSARLDAASPASREAALASWSGHLSENADILLYSCDTGARSEGLALVDALAGLTGADVAASDDRTGHTSLGGDWTLEVTSGRIETGALLSDVAMGAWRQLLPMGTVLDNFSTVSYSNNHGSANWATSWTETDASGGGAASGNIRIAGGQLRIETDKPDDRISRGVNLAGATAATLTFSFDGVLNFQNVVWLEASANGGASWSLLTAFSSPGMGFGNISLLPYASADTMVRFRVFDGSSASNYLQVDDFLITCDVPAANSPPTVTAPPSFTVTEDQAGNLVYTGTPFADADNDPLTVTLSIADGVIAGTSGGGVTVGGSATARTFSGSVANLNTYFTTAGNITYTTAANNTQARTLTTDVSDGVNAAPLNTVPG
ncbi:MAG: DUF4347 domain-containing protein, partial [Rubrivivax sp.]